MKKIIALAVAAAVAAPAMADLTIGGSMRYQLDNGANGIEEANASTNRVLLSVAGSSTAESGLFVAADGTAQIAGGDTTQDGGVTLTVGNSMANVVLGASEPAKVFQTGADQFKIGTTAGSAASNLRVRDDNNVALNVTAVEGLTFQITGNLDGWGADHKSRIMAGYDVAGVALKVGFDSSDSDAASTTEVSAATTVAGVAVAASYATSKDDANSWNVNASYMGFGIGYQADETATGTSETELYGSYSVANAAGVEGFTVTVGAGSAETKDTKMGVRLDYAF